MPNKNVNVETPGGGKLPYSESEAQALNAPVADPGRAEAQAEGTRRRKMFDNAGDKLRTLAEGIVDGITVVPIFRERGESADMRRGENSAYEFAGNMIGGAAGVVGGGPAKFLAETGEALGKTAAQDILRLSEKNIVTRGLQEAGAGYALAGAAAFGGQVLDTVIEDKQFSSEAVIKTANLGGLMGFGGGTLLGTFGKLASRAEVEAQVPRSVLEDALSAHEEVRAQYGEALHFHEQQLGAAKQLRKMGRLQGDDSVDAWLRNAEEAVRDARRAQEGLRQVNVKEALSGKDPGAYKEFQRWQSEYTRAMEQVDSVMRPSDVEHAVVEHPALAREAGPVGETEVAQTSSARPAPERPMRPVTPGEDFVVPANRVGQAIPDSGRYADGLNIEPHVVDVPSTSTGTPVEPPPAPTAPQPEPGTVVGKRSATPYQPEVASPAPAAANPLAPLDDIVRQLPVRAPLENAQAMAHTLVEPVPYGQVAPQLERTLVDPYAGHEARIDAAVSQAAEKAGTGVFTRETIPGARSEVQADVTRKLMDDWYQMSEPRVRPWQQARTSATASMDRLYKSAGGRFDSARALGILEADGIKPSADSIGGYMDAVYALNRTKRFVASEARGVATPLRDAMTRALGGKVARAVLGNAIGGPLGAVLGWTKFGGRLAAESGKLAQQVVDAANKFLSSTHVRAGTIAAANTAWAYSDKGPIKDPIERIQEIRALAGSPDAIRKRVADHAGDLSMVAPDQVKALQERAVQQMTALAMRAPAIFWDRLGRPLSPPQGKMRDWFEFENAMNNLDGILKAVETGNLTRPQADALQQGWSAVQVRLTQQFLQDPEKLQNFNRAKLRLIEMVTGAPLTARSDPMFIMRQQQAWAPPGPQQPPNKPQAFNINPDGAPTPSQATSQGRAPGN